MIAIGIVFLVYFAAVIALALKVDGSRRHERDHVDPKRFR